MVTRRKNLSVVEQYSFFALLAGVLVLVYFTFKAFLVPLIFAAMLAVALSPIYVKLKRLFRGSARAGSFFTVLLLLLCIIVPAVFLGFQVIREATNLYQGATAPGSQYEAIIDNAVNTPIQRFYPGFSFDVRDAIEKFSNWFVSNINTIFSGTLETVLQFFIIIISLFYFLKDGKRLTEEMITLSPLPERYDDVILLHIRRAVHSIVSGSLFIALIQGVLAGLGLFLFGVPNPALWGTIAAFAALVPSMGTALVIVPSIIFLFIQGHTFQAIGLSCWGIGLVGAIDNVLLPYLVGRGASLHPLFVLFAVLGGLAFFGPAGIFFGPLILSIAYALIDIYRSDFDVKTRAKEV
jgi:predicted PurR-regulated permease PerM